jgi:SpoVK/Ycf46/Vps4 family AAA+-type ATPase
LIGIPGCGKSLTAKAIATAWSVPLLRFDLGALRSKFVGESEGNLRKAFRVIEAIGRCVVWLDEIEKALQGATSGSADGGVSSDALGAILSWMQERSGEAFVIATANDVEKLPPELLRKGRFDDVWFVDLPNEQERALVLAATLGSYGRSTDGIDVRAVSRACAGFTGAEIAALVPDEMFVAFADNERSITTADLIAAASTVVPLSKTAGEKIDRLRAWAKGRARPATSNVTEIGEQKRVRAIDL